MTRPFDDATRRNIAERCADFARLPASEPAPALKRAAVTIALVEAGDVTDETALLLTLRAADLRAHSGRCRAAAATRARHRSRRRCANFTKNSALNLDRRMSWACSTIIRP